jgi:hypothetical protein
VTLDELLPVVAQYRAGLEAEMALLRRLRALAAREAQALPSPGHEVASLVDQRETVMGALVTIESQLKPLREILVAAREQLAAVPQFLEVSTLHQDAATLVASIAATDRESMAALEQAELTRRLAAEAVEKGENTLAAYRRVVAPQLAHATLVNRRG